MSNRITLEQLAGVPVKQASALPMEELAMLCEDLAALKAKVKSYDYTLHSIFLDRYAENSADLRAENGKETGSVRINDGNYVIVADLPKVVDWDQSELAKSVEKIRKTGEPIDQYVTVKYTVAESKWNAWPESLRSIFAPARSVGVGRETFKVEHAKEK